MKKSKQIVTLIMLSLILINSQVTQAAQESGLTINTLSIGFGGVSIGFTTQPAACGGSYNTMHGFISQSNPNFAEMFALVGQKRNSQQPIAITFSEPSNCTSQSTLLTISGVN